MESRLQAWKKYGERVCDCLKAKSSSWIKPTTIEEYVAFLRLVVIIVIIIARKPSSLGNRIGSWSYINNSSNDCQDTHNDCECFPNVQSHWQLFKGCSEQVKKTWKGFFSSVFVWIKMSRDKKMGEKNWSLWKRVAFKCRFFHSFKGCSSFTSNPNVSSCNSPSNK